MPIICIGPVCVPISALLPVVLVVFRPLYERLPVEYQRKVESCASWLQKKVNAFLRLLGFGRRKKSGVGKQTGEEAKRGEEGIGIVSVESAQDWHSQLKECHAVIAYFTSEWCKPCQEMMPYLQELALNCKPKPEAKCRVLKIDIDLMDDLAAELLVRSLPTYKLFVKGLPVDECSGHSEESRQKLRQLFASLSL